jgi:hypothetical protein
MSILSEAIGKCSKCGHEQKISLYKSINVAQDPELKEKVKNGSLFTWKCPNCGEMNLVKYATLYHDPAAKMMIWLLPGGSANDPQVATANEQISSLSDYTLRLVGDIGSLIEKVNILDAGLDDVAIEMCKYVTKMEMSGKMEDKDKASDFLASTFRFYAIDDDAIVFSYPSEGKMVNLKVGLNVYEDCQGILSRNPSVSPEPGFACVDARWLETKIK